MTLIIFSRHALQHLGYEFNVVTSAAELENAQIVVMSGIIELVGVQQVISCYIYILLHFVTYLTNMDQVQALQDRDLLESLRKYLLDNRLFLGIGVGMHFLFDSSDDHPDTKLLGVLAGSVSKLESWDASVPHIGWNGLTHVDLTASLSGNESSDVELVSCHWMVSNTVNLIGRFSHSMCRSISSTRTVSLPARRIWN